MNNAVVASDERTVKVFRGTEELVSGSIYHHSESLTVSISDTHDQYLYEATGGAKFEKGGCEGKRIADKKQAILKMPLTGEDDIKIVAGTLSADVFHSTLFAFLFFTFYFAFFTSVCHFLLLPMFAKCHCEIFQAHEIIFVGYDDMKCNRLGVGARGCQFDTNFCLSA